MLSCACDCFSLACVFSIFFYFLFLFLTGWEFGLIPCRSLSHPASYVVPSRKPINQACNSSSPSKPPLLYSVSGLSQYGAPVSLASTISARRSPHLTISYPFKQSISGNPMVHHVSCTPNRNLLCTPTIT